MTFALDFHNFPAIRAYEHKQAMWDASLTQDTYAVPEAAKVMNMGERKVRDLLKSGALYHENRGQRRTVIPRVAIIRYIIGPGPLEGLLGNAFE